MSAQVLTFPGGTILPLQPARILRGVAMQKPEAVFVIALQQDGSLTLHSSEAGLQFNLSLVERARHRIVKILEGEA